MPASIPAKNKFANERRVNGVIPRLGRFWLGFGKGRHAEGPLQELAGISEREKEQHGKPYDDQENQNQAGDRALARHHGSGG